MDEVSLPKILDKSLRHMKSVSLEVVVYHFILGNRPFFAYKNNHESNEKDCNSKGAQALEL